MAKYTKAQLQEMAKIVRQGLIDGDPRSEMCIMITSATAKVPLYQVNDNIDRYAAGRFVPGEAKDL